MAQWFPYFLSRKPEFYNKELMIGAAVSSRSCFCQLFIASPSLAAKNIISLILELTVWCCPRVKLSFVLLERSVCYDQCVLLTKFCQFLPCFILYSRPKLPVILGISQLPTFSVQSPMIKSKTFLSVSSRHCRSSQNWSTLVSQVFMVGAQAWITVMLNDLPWK